MRVNIRDCRRAAAILTAAAILMMGVFIGGCKGGAAGGGGASGEPTRESFKGDPSKMTPEQRKQMEQVMSGGKPPANAPIPK